MPKTKNMGYMNNSLSRSNLENRMNLAAEQRAKFNITDGDFVFSRRTLQSLEESDDNSRTGTISASATDQDSLAGTTTNNQSLTAHTEGNKTFSEHPSKKVVANDKDTKLHQQYEDLLKDNDNPKSLTQKDRVLEKSDLGEEVAEKYATDIEPYQKEDKISTIDSDFDHSLSGNTRQQDLSAYENPEKTDFDLDIDIMTDITVETM